MQNRSKLVKSYLSYHILILFDLRLHYHQPRPTLLALSLLPQTWHSLPSIHLSLGTGHKLMITFGYGSSKVSAGCPSRRR